MTPGSDEALAVGCLCPVLDNHHGRGTIWGEFWINVDCPVHGEPTCQYCRSTGVGEVEAGLRCRKCGRVAEAVS